MTKKEILLYLFLLIFTLTGRNTFAHYAFCQLPINHRFLLQTNEDISLQNTLTVFSAMALSSKQEKEFSRFWAVFLNITPGFGLGSFLQRNTLGGVIQASVEIIPTVYGTYQAIDIMKDWSPIAYLLFPFVLTYAMGKDIWPLLVVTGGRIFGVVSALTYKPKTLGKDEIEKSLAISSNGFAFYFKF